jgi:hypothetical protein
MGVRVVVRRVGVIVAVVVIMAVVVPVPVPVPMAVIVRVGMALRRAVVVAHRAAVAIGPALRGEGTGDGAQPRAQPLQHAGQHVIVPDQQVIGMHGAGSVAVADVPREARQVALDPQQRLGRGLDRDPPPVLEFQRVARIERHGLRQVDEDRGPGDRLQPLAPQKPGVIA